MKVAIPSFDGNGLDSDISAHFGSSSHFTIVTLNDAKISGTKVIENKLDGPHSCAGPVDILRSEGVDLVLLINIGPRPLEILKSQGIDVLCGAFGMVKDAIYDYLEGFLYPVDMNNTCNCNHDH
ncbi:MAG: NifB/NifX family molybdenum-iron cluster-binding protein [Halobacteriota archaeon]|nr:NifB/NifX family molybdenum-iron cluster-binding protein [Halobacteriota archaeon]